MMEEVRVKVHGREVSLGKPETRPQELVVHPAGPNLVLVAYTGRNEHGPYGGSTLWQISCKDSRAEVMANVPDADFGHSALSPAGNELLFTGPDGIFALDLETRKSRRLTQAPDLAHCDTNDRPRALDVVGRFMNRNTLSFQRGGPCGYEAEWEATGMLLRNPGAAGTAVERAPRPPFPSVAVDASGGAWLADGLCEDRSTYGRILFSSDHGDHWQKVRVSTVESHPMRNVIADRAKPGSLLVLTFACGSSAHVDPGWVYLTDDAGKTFRPIAVPPGIRKREDGAPASEQDPLQAVAAPDGAITHLILYGDREDVSGNMVARWESRDGGRSWKTLAPVKSAPRPPSPSATAGEWTLTIRKDGLYHSRRGSPEVRVYPRR
jgi:hypothetical protein